MHTAGIDNMVPEFAREGIFLFVFLFGVVFFRAQSTYWLARGVASGAMRASGRTGFLGAMAPFPARARPCSTSGALSRSLCAF